MTNSIIALTAVIGFTLTTNVVDTITNPYGYDSMSFTNGATILTEPVINSTLVTEVKSNQFVTFEMNGHTFTNEISSEVIGHGQINGYVIDPGRIMKHDAK